MSFLANAQDFLIEAYLVASSEFALDVVLLIHWELEQEFWAFLLEENDLFVSANPASKFDLVFVNSLLSCHIHIDSWEYRLLITKVV